MGNNKKNKKSGFRNFILILCSAVVAMIYMVAGMWLVYTLITNDAINVSALVHHQTLKNETNIENEPDNKISENDKSPKDEADIVCDEQTYEFSIAQEPRFTQESEIDKDTYVENETEDIHTLSELETETAFSSEIETDTEYQTVSSIYEDEKMAIKNADKVEQAVTTIVTDVTEVVKAAMPCVVSITNAYSTYDFWSEEMVDDEANGSGIIIAQNDTELLIVTNYHVIQDNKELYVQFIDGTEKIAYVKGADASTDLAVVSVFLDDIEQDTIEQIAIATLGDSDNLQVGEPAIAIGNSLGYGQSVTTGVISALNREVAMDDSEITQGFLIQTDAAINPGNSGGALLNVKGEVIGINSSKIADYVIEGMGYAIPISTAKPIIDELVLQETRKKVAEEKRGFLGVSGKDMTAEVASAYNIPEGVYVVSVIEDSAAEKYGIFKGDIIISIDNENITQMTRLQEKLKYYEAGTSVEIVVLRQEKGEYKEKKLQVELGLKK